MIRVAVIAVAVTAGILIAPAQGGDNGWTCYPGGGAAGGTACYLPNGDLLNLRNIQGGMKDDPNLDIGAGSTENPGTLALNWDVGKTVAIFDGKKHLLAKFDSTGITFYREPRVR